MPDLEAIIENILSFCAGSGIWGYVIVALLIAIENIFPPIPSEVILGFGGMLTAQKAMVPWAMVLAATLGAYAGAILLYLVGRFFNEDRLTRILDGKIGKILRLKGEDVAKAVKWFERRGEISVLVCRCVPIVRSLISIPAGTCRMNFIKFTAYTLVGSAVWNTVLVFLGNLLGENWKVILGYLDMYQWAVAAIIVVIFAAFVVYHFFLKNKIKNRKSEKKD